MSNVLTENEAAAVAAFSKMTEDAAKIADQYKAMAKTYEATLKLAEQYKLWVTTQRSQGSNP